LINIIDKIRWLREAGPMAATSEQFTELGDEFALVAQTAAEAGADAGLPRVRSSSGAAELGLLGGAAALIRGDRAGPLTAADFARL
jgi:hypothetical protein